ncbi:hypothetical protein ABZ234_08285 [Nocardiopsis sp. NPDC006198]|uniref:hypothetical protein n=1 Tax=Nocardiopsis sp. NPDC006198 TaxID=3154472 RepID=UPI0033A3996F
MPKHHRARKQQARREQRRTGAAYTSALAGTTHTHPAPEMAMLAELAYVQGHPLDLERAAALVGACRAGCRPCQDSLIPLVAAHPATVAALTGAALGALPPGLSLLLGSRSTRSWIPLLHQAPPDGRADAPVTALQTMSPEQVREILEDGLDLWAAGGAPAPVFETLTVDHPIEVDPAYDAFVTYIADENGPVLPMLPLIPEGVGASLEDLRTRCGLPAWDMSGLPPAAAEWVARFDISSRSLVEIVRVDDEGFDDVVLCRPAEQAALPQEWWELLDRTSTVVLCGAVTDLDHLDTAAQDGRIVGVRARARFW